VKREFSAQYPNVEVIDAELIFDWEPKRVMSYLVKFKEPQSHGVLSMEKVNLTEKLALINEHWRPKVVGELNGQEVKLVKFQGEFPWHRHEAEDEMFLAMKGNFRIEFRDRTI
jgi:mannose-6-phosphate isomerase-like protein (cupin superfamily)